MNIISVDEAIAQGSGPGFFRVLANSLERLGRQYLVEQDKESANVNFQNARRLRNLAKAIAKKVAK